MIFGNTVNELLPNPSHISGCLHKRPSRADFSQCIRMGARSAGTRSISIQ
jgi:hypothetical protein